MRLNKKHTICFCLIIFITLMSCFIVSAADTGENMTTTTTNNEVTTNVEHTNTINNNAQTVLSTDNSMQSDENYIEETDDQNVVKDENNKIKALNNAKKANKTLKTATTIPSSGEVTLTENIRVTSTITVTGDLTVNGNGHTITASGISTLFSVTSSSTSITLNNVIVTGVSGYVIEGGSNHQFISSQFYNDGGIWEATQKIQDTTTLMTNCYFVGLRSNAFILNVHGSQRNKFEVYNVIFDGCSSPIIATFQHSDFTGYNFIFNDKVVVNASQIGTNYNQSLFVDENQFYGTTNSFPLAKHSQGEIDIGTQSSDTRIFITCTPVVHINQTNVISVKLNATVSGRDLGVPFETVYITIQYANGSSENLVGTTDSNGYVENITDHDGNTFNSVKALESGIVQIDAEFRGSKYVLPGDEYLYKPNTNSTTYTVIGIPTTTTLQLNKTSVDNGDPVILTATVTNTDDSDVKVNEGIVTFYNGDTPIATVNVTNGVATYNYVTDTAGNLQIRAEYSNASHYDASNSTAATLTVAKSNAVVITAPEAIYRYANDIIELWVNVTANGNNVTTVGPTQTFTINGTSSDGEGVRFWLVGGTATRPYFTIGAINGTAYLGNITNRTGGLQGRVRVAQAIPTTYTATLPEGYYYAFSFNICYDGDNNYLPSTENVTTVVYVMREPTVTTITNTSGSVTGKVRDTITLTANVVNTHLNSNVNQGTVTFYKDNTELGVATVSDGTATLPVVFNQTDYDGQLTAIYNDVDYVFNNMITHRINQSTATVNLKVENRTATITLPSSYSDIIGNTASITATVTDSNGSAITSGTVIFNDGTDHEVNINNGQAVYPYTYASTNPVTIAATLSNANYTTVSASTTATGIVIPTTTTISNVPTSANVEESFTFNVRLNTTNNAAVTGKNIVVKINGEEITGLEPTDNNGEISVTYTPKNNTSIIINATFEGDEIYDKSNDTDSSLTSDKISLIPTKVTLDVTPTTGTVYSPISITVGLTNNTSNDDNTVTGTVKLYINGNSQDITINPTQKTVTVTYTPEDNSDITVYAEYTGKEGIYDANRTENMIIPVNLIETNLLITVPDEVTVSDNFRFNITLTNKTSPNDKISGRTDKITAKVNNEDVDVYYDDVNAIYYATYTPTSNTEDLVFKAEFAGDNQYAYSDADDVTLDNENIKLIPTAMGIIVPDDVKVGTEFTFKVNLTNSSGDAIPNQAISVVINNETYTGGLTYVDGLYQGVYTPKDNTAIVIDAVFTETNVYEGTTATNNTLTTEHIKLIGTLISVEHPTTVNVSQPIVLVINLTDDYNNRLSTSNITVKVDGHAITTGKTFSDDNLTLTVNYPTVRSETLEFLVEYPGVDGVYDGNTTTFNVDVVKIPTTTTVTVINNTAGNVKINVSVKGDDDVDVTDGNITVTVNGQPYDPVALNGQKVVTIPLDNLVTYGNYTINVQYSGNDTYALSNAQGISPIEVIPQNITFNITANESVYVTEYVNITGVLKDGFDNPINNRELTLNITDENGVVVYEATPIVNNGVYSVLYPTTKIGVFNVTVYFSGQDGIKNTTRETNFTVNLIPTKTVADVYNNTAGNFSISVNITDNREGNEDTPVETGRIKVVINNDEENPVYHTITSSESIIKLPSIINNSTKSIVVIYEANDKYNTSSAPAFDVNARIRETTLTISATPSTEYNKTITINGTLKGELGTGIESTGKVTFTFNGTSYTHVPVDTDNEGKFSFTIRASEIGNFEVNATFEGIEGVFKSSNATTTFNVTKITTDTEVLIAGESASDLRVLFRVYNDTSDVRYGNLALIIDETTINVTDLSGSNDFTEINGIRYVVKDFSEEYLESLGISGGVTSIKAVYDENDYYLSSNDLYSGSALDNAVIKVTVNQSSIFVDGSVNITVNVTDLEGNPIRGQLTLKINDNTTTATITANNNGIYSIIYSNSTADTYNVIARLDSAIYETVNDSTSFNITKIPTKTNVTIHNDSWGNASIDVVVYDARSNTTISTGNLHVLIGNVAQTTVDEEITSAITNIPITTQYAGEFAITVNYLENPTYLSSNGVEDGTGNAVVIDILKHDANLTVTTDKSSYEVGENVTIRGYLYDVNTGLPISGQTVHIDVRNSTTSLATYNPITNAEGYYEVNRTTTVAGTFTINATFEGLTIAGESNINAVNNSTTYTVNRIPTTTTVRTLNSTYGNITISINVKGDDGLNITEGTLTIKFGSAVLTAEITGNETVIKLPSIGVDTHPLNVSYPGNNKYVESNNTDSSVTSITVQNQTATITVVANPEEVIVGEAVKISGYVYDGINNQTNLINGTVNITFKDENNDVVTVNTTLNNSYYEYTRITEYAGLIDVTVSYINDTFNNSTNKTTYTVDKIPTNTTVSIYNDTYGKVQLAVTIVDARNDNPIKSGKYNLSVNNDVRSDVVFGQDNTWINSTTFIVPVDTTSREITVTLNYTGDNTHESSVGKDENGVTPIIINSKNQSSTLTIEVNQTQTYAGESLKINGTLIDELGNVITGKINLTFTNGTHTYTVEEDVTSGRYTHIRTVNMTGVVNVTASFLGDDDHIDPANATTNYTINKLPTKVTITVVNNTVGNLTIGVQVDETYHNVVLENGNITIQYGENIISDAQLSGNVTLFNLTSTSQAPIEITVNFTENLTHAFSTNNINTGQLVRQTGNLTISANDTVKVDETVIINGTFKDGMNKSAEREIIINIYNSTGSLVKEISTRTNADGTYREEFVPNKNGSYTAVASYVGGDIIAPITTEAYPFTVEKIDTTTNVTVLNNTAGNVTIKVKVTDENANNITSGQLKVTIDGTSTIKDFTNVDEYTLKLDSIVTNGTHDVTVEYLGTDDKYNPSTGINSTSLTGDQLTTIDVELQQSSITILKDANKIYIGDNITIYGRLTDGMGRPIGPNTIVNITFVDENGHNPLNVYNTTDSDGWYYYHRTTEYNGTIHVNATYYGEENKINASSATITYVVDKIPTYTYINTLNNTLGNVTIEVWVVSQLDSDEEVTDGNLSVYVNSATEPHITYKMSDLTLNENGRYTIKLNADYDDGENSVRVVYSGNGTYVGSQAQKSGRLYKDDVELNITLDKNSTFVNNTINANVSLTHDGNPLAGRLNITIYNSTGDIVKVITTTDDYLENGKISFSFTDETSDEYTIKVEYNGSEIYNALNATKTFTLNKLPTETLVDVVSNVIGNVSISVKVNDTQNNKIVTIGSLIVTVDGTPLNPINVNDSGVTIIPLTTTGSSVLVTVTYMENYHYNASVGINTTSGEQFTNITLVKQPTRITVVANPNETYIGTPITISGNLINPLGDVNNQLIRIIINDIPYEVRTTTDDTGSYTFTYDAQTSIANGNGTFTVNVEYDPTTNTVANASHNSTTIKVDKIPTNTSISIVNNTVGNITVNVKVVNASNGGAVTTGTVEFYGENDKLIGSYPITKAENIIKLGNITESGDITVTAKYIENNIYLGSDVKLDDDKTESLENITVRNQTATITIDVIPSTVIIGESVTINGTLADGMGQNITGDNIVVISIDNENYIVNVSNGKFSLINITYTQGVKKVNATYLGNNTIDPVTSTTKNFTVNLIPTNTTVGVVNTTVGSVVINVNVTDEVSEDLVTTGVLSVKVGGNDSRIVPVNTTGGITFIPLTEITSMDNVTVVVEYLANELYNSSKGLDVATLQQLNPNDYVEINTTRHNSIMEASVIESPVKVGQNITIIGTLVIDNGTNVDNGTTGDNEIVQIWIGNINVGNATVNNGKFEYNYTTSQVTDGKTATIIYNGTELVKPTDAVVNYVVEKLPTITIINVLNNTAGNVTLNITVNDSFNNEVISNGVINVIVGDGSKFSEIESFDNGYLVVEFQDELSIPQPNVIVTATFIEDDIYNGSSNNTVFTVISQVANITVNATPNPASVGDSVTITGRLVDGMNRNISNAELSWNIGTRSDRTTTDENGTYTFTYVPTAEGVYEVNVTYAGGGAVGRITGTTNLTVNRIPTNTTVEVLNTTVENVTISVKVTDNQTQAITSGQFNVTVQQGTWTNTSTFNINGTSTIVNLEQLNITTADNDYNITVVYLGDNKYINSTGFDDEERSVIPIHIDKQNATLTITANPTETTVGRNVTLSIDLKCGMGHGITDNVTLNITSEAGSEIVPNVQVTDGIAIYNRTSHLAGHVNVTVIYAGNETINPLNATTNYTINKIPTTTSFVRMVNDTFTNITIEIRFTDNIDGHAINSGSNFTIELEDKPESIVTYNLDEDASDDRFNVTSSGTIIIKIDESHFSSDHVETAIIKFLGNGTYNASNTTVSEDITKEPITIDLKVNDSVYINQTVTVDVTVKDMTDTPIEATVNITINGEEFETDVVIPVDGKVFTFNKTESGNYTVKVTYPGNALLASATANSTVEVNKIPTNTSVTILNNTYGNVTIKVTVNDTLNDKLLTDGTLIITGGAPCNVTLNGTETIIKLNVTNVRNTNVYVRFNGTDYYQPSYGLDNQTGDQFESIDVVRQTPTLTFDVQPNPNHVGNGSVITGKLVDGMGENITDGTVNILINNITYASEVSLNQSGEFSIPYTGNEEGTYNITVEYSGNRYVNNITANKTLTLNKVNTTTIVTVLDNTAGNVTIRVNVTDEFNQPVTTGNFTVNITIGQTVEELNIPITGDTTDVLLPINVADDFKVNVTYTGTNRYNSSVGYDDTTLLNPFTNITVKKQDVNLTVDVLDNDVYYGRTVIVEGTLTNASGDAIAGVNITLTFNGENPVNVTTLTNGYYSYPRETSINGNVTVVAYYAGDDKYNDAKANDSYMVNKIPTNTTVSIVNNTVGNVTIDVQVRDANDPLNIITNGTINVTVNNVTTQHNITGSITNIKLNITNCTTANVTVLYLGNYTYENSTGIDRSTYGTDTPVEFTNITADKQNATLTIAESPSPVIVYNEVTYNGTLVDGLGNNITGQINITVTLGNEVIDNKTVDVINGTYDWTRTSIKVGETLNVTASYLGNDTINPVNASTIYIVNKRPTVTLVNITNNTAGNVTMDVEVRDANGTTLNEGNFTVKVQDQPDAIVNINGTVTPVKLNITTATQYITVSVIYNGNETYNTSMGIDMDKFLDQPSINETVTNITVDYQTPTMTINPIDDSKVGDTIIITGHIEDGMGNNITNRNITVSIGETVLSNRTDENGNYTVYYTSTNNGTFTAIANYPGNNTIRPMSVNTTFTVTKLQTTTIVEVLNRTAGNVTINVNITDERENPVNHGEFNITIDEENPDNYSITGNITTVKLNVEENGTIKVNVTYLGDDQYESSNGQTIDENTGELVDFTEIDVIKQDVNLTVTVNNHEIPIGTVVVINGDLLNSSGFGIAYADINLTFNGSDSEIVHTDSNGHYRHERVTSIAGDIEVKAYYNGSAKYNNLTATDNYTVYKLPTNTTVRVVNKTAGNVYIDVIVWDMYYGGIRISNGTLNITVNNKTTSVDFTTSNTTIPLDIQNDTTANVTVVYLGNNTYLNSTGITLESFRTDNPDEFTNITADKQDATITLNVNETNITVFNNIKFNGTLVDGLGNNINATISITVNNGTDNFTYTGIEVKDGYYELNRTTNLTGTIDVTVNYPGNDSINPLNITEQYNVNKRDTITLVEVVNDTLGNLTIDIVVKDALTGEELTEGADLITVHITEGSYPYSINETGITRITVPVNDNREFVKVTVDYLGNGTYNPSLGINNATYTSDYNETFTNITVKQHNSTLTMNVTPVNSTVGTVYNISGYFTDINGTAIEGANLIVSINNTYYNDSVITGQNGYYSVNYTSNHEGNYTVTVKFNGNDVVNATVNTTTFTVNKIPTNTTVYIVNNTVGNVTLNVTVTDVDGKPINGTLNVSIGNTTKQVNIENGEKIIDLNEIGLGINSTDAIYAHVVFNGNDTYINSTGIDSRTLEDDTPKEFNEIKADQETAIITVDVDPRNVTIGNIYDIFGKLTDINGNIIPDATINITVNNTDGIIYSENVTANANTGRFIYENNTLPAGTYTINASFYNDDYKYTSAEVTLTVSKILTNTEASVANNTAGNVTVHVIVTDNKGRDVTEGIVNIVNESGDIIGTATLDENNQGVVDVVLDSIKTNGTYTFNVTYEGTPKYDESSDEINTEVITRDVTIIATPENTTFENTTVKVNLTDSTTGESLPNAPFNITDENGDIVGNGTTEDDGTTVVNITVPVGEQTLTVVYPGNETYNATNKTFTIDVDKRESTTEAEIVNNTAGNVTVRVNVTDSITGNPITSGNITIIANDEEVARVEFNNETGIVDIPTNITKSGDYDITAVFEGNTNYTGSEDDLGTQTINKRNATVDYDVLNETVGNTTINVTVTDSITGEPVVNGTVNITLPDGTPVGNGTTDENGTAIINITVPITTTDIIVNYTGNITYNENVTTQPINIVQRNSTTVADLTNNTAGNVTIQVNVTDSTTGEAVPNGPVTVYVNDTVVGSGEINNGTATIITNITEAGTYDIDVVYEGNENYTSSDDLLDDVEIVGRESELNPEITNTTVGNTTINVTLVDPVTDEPIVNATVIVTLPNGTEVNGTTDENGSVIIPVDLPVGNNTVNITYPGDETYNGTNTTITVDVGPRDSTTIAEVTNNTAGNVTIQVNVTDTTTDQPVPNGPVTVYVNDTVVGSGEINNGTATIITNITEAGTYDIDVVYEGNENYTSSDDLLDDVEIVGRESELIPEVTNATIGNTTVNVTLVDPTTDEPIPNATIIVTLPNGTEVNGTTDENGSVILPIDIPAGNNTLNITYPGNETYNATNTTITVDVDKRTADIQSEITSNIAGNTSITSTITDEITNEPVTNATVILTLDDGTQIEATTDDEGVVVFENIPSKEGTAQYNITLLENPRYHQADDNITTEIVKTAVIVTVDEVYGIVGENIKLIAHVTDINGNLVNGGNLIFKINGLTLKDDMKVGTTNSPYVIKVRNGIVEVEINAYLGLRNAINISAAYGGSSTYYANRSDVESAHIDLRDAIINVSTVKVAKQNQEINFTAVITDITPNATNTSLVDEGYVQFKVNGLTLKEDGQTVRVKVVNNTATYTYKVPLGSSAIDENGVNRAYNISVSYDNPYYNMDVRNSTVYNIERRAITFNYTNVTVKDNKLSIKANLIDDECNFVVGTNKACLKLNNKTYLKDNNTQYFYITNGIVDISGIEVDSENLSSITLVTGDREAYLSTRDTTSNIVKS